MPRKRRLLALSFLLATLAACSTRSDSASNPKPPPPAGESQAVVVSADGDVTIDLLAGTSIDAGTASVLITRPPRFGVLQDNGDGTVTYTATASWPDEDVESFTYALAAGGSDYGPSAEVTIFAQRLPTPTSVATVVGTPAGETPTPSDTARLEAQPSGADLGEQCLDGCTAEAVVELRSSGTLPIEILDDGTEAADSSEEFGVSGECSGITLEPGESCQLTVRFDPASLGLHQLQLPITHSGDNSPLVLSIRGTGVPPPLQASVQSLQFGATCVWDCTETLEIEFAASYRDVTISSTLVDAFADNGAFAVRGNCAGRTLDADGTNSCRMTIDFAPQTRGEHSMTWEVHHSANASPLLIPIHGIAECASSVPSDLLDLLNRRVGYGQNATGGAAGCLYVVTSDEERGPGTLREGAERGGAWIVFDGDYDIWVRSGLTVGPNTTIDGRGRDVSISGGSGTIRIQRKNIIITGIEINSARGASTLDGIEIGGAEATDIWIDHVSFLVAPDELLPIFSDRTPGNAAGNITVTWSRFGEGGRSQSSEQTGSHAILIADQLNDGEGAARTHLTLAYNYFVTHSRSPLVGDGARVHAFNNLYADWTLFGMGVKRNGQIRSEANIFAASTGPRLNSAFGPQDELFGREVLYDDGSWFPNGASGQEVNREEVFTPGYSYRLLAADEQLQQLIAVGSGS